MRKFQRLSRGGDGAQIPGTLRVLGGNLVPPHDTPGVVRVDTILAESAFDTLDPTGNPPTGLPWPDGIGYGEIDGDRVLIVHDGRGPLQYAVTKDQQFRVFAQSFTSALGFGVYVPLYAVAS